MSRKMADSFRVLAAPPKINVIKLNAVRPDAIRTNTDSLKYRNINTPVSAAGIKVIQDDMKGKLDGMNEMSEMTSLRLQMMMDRRSKFISTLSNIMKKISTTQDTLVQNLK